jgi:hypothetical protein
VRRGKALAAVVEAAKVVDTSGRAVDIKALNAAESARGRKLLIKTRTRPRRATDGAEAETANADNDQPGEAIRS